MSTSIEFLSSAINTFEASKRLAEKAILQVPQEKLHVALDDHTNSIAIIMKHIAGNLISRWTNFLSSDGEKPWRQRDEEFIDTFSSREELMKYWEDGWQCVIDSLHRLKEEDLSKSVTIRGEKHSVPLAIERSLSHISYHIGQIVLIARIHAGDDWETLTIPRGQSEQFNKANWGPDSSPEG